MYKTGLYKGIPCDSSWELAFLLWAEICGYTARRSTTKLSYIYKNRSRNYEPDFELTDGETVWVVEIKGRTNDPQWRAKEKSLKSVYKERAIVLGPSEMRRIIHVVEEHIGKGWENLYETKGVGSLTNRPDQGGYAGRKHKRKRL